jgi:hypothetical protein
MLHRPLRSAIALSLGALLALAGGVAADTLKADGDGLTTTIDVGAVAPGAVLTVDVNFILTCASSTHVDHGQTVTAAIDFAQAPADGEILLVTDGTVGPVLDDWPAENVPCAIPAQTYSAGTPSVVTLRAPTTSGLNYTYSLIYHRSILPFGVNDANAVRTATAVDIVLDVNSPPTLTLPTLAGVGTVEGNHIDGWFGPWLGLGATDLEDDPDPTATCDPVAGTVLPLGPTTVTCSVTDSGGLTTSDSFVLTVLDTTPPAMLSVPADFSVTTADPAGTTVAYGTPSAMDLVDSHPAVGCLPASGSHFDVGSTPVTCTATDESGNSTSESFNLTVIYVTPHTASAIWGEPVAGNGTTFVANRGRNIPIKVELFLDGVAVTSGSPELIVSPCATGSGVRLALIQGNGRWNVGLDTSVLDGSCYTITATIDGLEAGSFHLDLRGADPTKAKAPAAATTASATPAKLTAKAAKADKDSAKELAKAAKASAKELAKAAKDSAKELAKDAKIK